MKNKKMLTYIVIFLIATTLLIFNINVWCDEAASINLTSYNWNDLIYFVKKDFHPPLYYLALKTWGHFTGHNLISYKFFSIIPVILSALFVCIWFKKRLPKYYNKYNIIFVILIFFAPCNMGKNIEVRMYTWAAFWVSSFLLTSWELRENSFKDLTTKKKIFLHMFLIISGACACYTHYFAGLTILVIGIISIIMLIKQKNKNELINYSLSCIGVFVCFLPWLFIFFKQINDNIPIWTIELEMKPVYTLNILRYPFEGDYSSAFPSDFTPILWIIIVSMLIYSIHLIKTDTDNKKTQIIKYGVECFSIFISVFIIGLIVSYNIHPILMRRYLFPSVNLLWLSVALMSASFCETEKLRSILIGILTVLSISSYVYTIEREYETGTKATLNFFTNSDIKDDDIIINNIEICACWELKYYFPNNDNFYEENDIIYATDYVTAWYLPNYEQINESDKTIWYFCNNNTNLNVEKYVNSRKNIEEVYKGNLDNYYNFKIYKISPVN